MNLRPLWFSITLLGLLAAHPLAQGAEAKADAPVVSEPPASLIVNNSKDIYHVRISDDLSPVGLVKFYEAKGDAATPPVTCTTRDQYFKLPPGGTVRMVICGSRLDDMTSDIAFSAVPVSIRDEVRNKVKNKIVALYISLDKCDKADKVVSKSLTRYHFVHGVEVGFPVVEAARLIQDLAALGLPPQVNKLVGSMLDRALLPLSKDSESKNIATITANYQKEDAGPLWVIKQ
jgi:hypothetical protein